MSDLLIERFDPIPAILKSKYYKETRGFVVGKEHNVKFGGFRYIFEYNFPPLMRSTNLPATFPMGEMYVSENEIEFTKGVDK